VTAQHIAYIFIHSFIHSIVHSFIHSCMCVYVWTYVCMYVRTYVCVCVCVCARGCNPKFPDWVDNEIYAYLWYYLLRSKQGVMAAKLARLTHKVSIQLHLLAESCTICSSRSRRPVRKLFDTPSYSMCVNYIHVALHTACTLRGYTSFFGVCTKFIQTHKSLIAN
jgi:hypothetical protein